MVEIQLLRSQDIQPIAAAFGKLGWDKPESQYERYLAEQISGQRLVLVANLAGIFAGYVTIMWESRYRPFREAGIPEIVDFNVLPADRRQGIGTMLMDEAEYRISQRASIVGIGVGMTEDYGAAHILYIKRGYIPDGRGISWNGKICQYGDQVVIDDSLAIYFTKKINRITQLPTG